MNQAARCLFALAISLPTISFAQYKCVINGKTVYADAPCAADAKHVGALEDRVSRESQLDRERINNKESRHLGSIETDNLQERRIQERDARNAMARDRAEASIKASRCASAQRDLQSAQRASAVYRDLGMQHSLNQRRGELDSAERRARDECN